MGYDPEIEEILKSIRNKDSYEHKTTPIDLPPPKRRNEPEEVREVKEDFEPVLTELEPPKRTRLKEEPVIVPEKEEEKAEEPKPEEIKKEPEKKAEKEEKPKREKPKKEPRKKAEKKEKPAARKKITPFRAALITIIAIASITALFFVSKGIYLKSLESKYNVSFPKGIPMAFCNYYGENPSFVGTLELEGNENETPVYSEPKNGGALFENGSDINTPQHYRAVALSVEDIDLEALYKDGKDFLNSSQTFTFNTVYGEKEKYQIIAAYIVNTRPEDDNGYAFPYNLYGNLTEKSYRHYQDTIKCRSLYTTGYKIAYTDYCMTLSVPSNIMPNFRFVIVGVKKDKPEKITEVKENVRIRYPQIYCDRLGIRNIYARFSSKWYPEIVIDKGKTKQLTEEDFK